MKKALLINFIFLIFYSSVFAHSTHVHSNGFITGFSHPVLGLDHLLAMIAVGILSAVMTDNALWRLPLLFVSAMLVGGLFGGYGIELPLVEIGISFSVIALGLVIAIAKPIPFYLPEVFVVLFGLLHGHAHGTEMPAMVEPILYGLGFVTGTIALHLSGVLIAIASKKIPKGDVILRLSGLFGVLTGCVLMSKFI